jgi:hypothetical protein
VVARRQTDSLSGHPQGKLTLRLQDTTATGGDDSLLDRPVDSTGLLGSLLPTDWSRDGRYIVYMRSPGVAGSTDLWVRPMFGEQPPLAVVESAASEQQGTISPDGRWIAFMSNESGLSQVYVAPFPPAPGRYMVSREGGSSPQWRADGKELFFMAFDSTIMAATVTSTDHFESQTPHPLFSATLSTSTQGRPVCAVAGWQPVSGESDRPAKHRDAVDRRGQLAGGGAALITTACRSNRQGRLRDRRDVIGRGQHLRADSAGGRAELLCR